MDLLSIKKEPDDNFIWEEASNGGINIPESNGRSLEKAGNSIMATAEAISSCCIEQSENGFKKEEASDPFEETGMENVTLQVTVEEEEDNSDENTEHEIVVDTRGEESDAGQEDWKKREAKSYQKGELLTIKKADCSLGESSVVIENDPFSCEMAGCNRKLKYEWLCKLPEELLASRLSETKKTLSTEGGATNKDGRGQSSSDTSTDHQPLAPRTNVDAESPAPEASKQMWQQASTANHHPLPQNKNVSRQPPARKASKRIRQQTSTANHQILPQNKNVAGQPPAHKTPKRIQRQPSASNSTMRRKTHVVRKKLTSRIIDGEAVQGDNFMDTMPVASESADGASLAQPNVVREMKEMGEVPKVSEEWEHCTPRLACSAVCDAKFSVLQKRLDELEMKVQDLEGTIKHLSNQEVARDTTIQQTPGDIPFAPVSDTSGQQAECPVRDIVTSNRQRFDENTENLLLDCGQDRIRMVRLLVPILFSREERLQCNTTGKYGKKLLDTRKQTQIRQTIFSIAPVASRNAEETEWKKLKVVIDQYNRHFRQRERERLSSSL